MAVNAGPVLLHLSLSLFYFLSLIPFLLSLSSFFSPVHVENGKGRKVEAAQRYSAHDPPRGKEERSRQRRKRRKEKRATDEFKFSSSLRLRLRLLACVGDDALPSSLPSFLSFPSHSSSSFVIPKRRRRKEEEEQRDEGKKAGRERKER